MHLGLGPLTMAVNKVQGKPVAAAAAAAMVELVQIGATGR